MRVTFDSFHRSSAAAIEMATERLAEAQRQVATGKRVERGSDDPAAAASAIVERAHMAATDMYAAAGDSAHSRLMVVDTVLTDLGLQLEAAQVSLTGARGTAVTAQQREARAKELEGLRDAILRDLNTSFEGTYLFAGVKSTVAPFVKNGAVVSAYQGSTSEMSVGVDNGVDVAVALNGEAITKGADTNDVFVELDNAIAAVRNGDAAGMDAAATALQRASDRVSLMQGQVGTSMTFIEDADTRLGEASRSAKARIAALVDANMASAISSMTQAETIYKASLGAAAQNTRPSLMDYLR